MHRSWIVAATLSLWGTAAVGPAFAAELAPAASAPAVGVSSPSGRALSRSFAAVAHAIGPAVVQLAVSRPDGDTNASGIVLDTRGNVVTSARAFRAGAMAGAARPRIEVTLADGRRLPAELVGTDAASDVAIVRLEEPPGDLSAARFGDSDEAEVGEWVLAVGNPLGLAETFTAGIVSGRPELDGVSAGGFLLTDAKVNPGDAGGPLVDLEGQVVGLTTLISAGPGGGYAYAVPINRVRRVAEEIIKDGHANHPYIGVALKNVEELPAADRSRLGALPPEGALVSRVGEGTPAARAGLRPGDVITAVGEREVPAAAEVVTIIGRAQVGARVPVSFVRRGETHKVVISVEDLQADPAAR
ncbi:MAG TPA: trypsin-like peptidase domain-containing protein [Polyangia bacterium]|nr:trypsin-like peptidase domain-containing protein [Polyangia bacterium]